MTTSALPSVRVARNIIKNYSREKFVHLIDLFQSGTSGTDIATEYGVSRQRVNQWKQKLGIVHETYIVHPQVEQLLHGRNRHTII